MKYIVYVPFDLDREHFRLPDTWIRERFEMFVSTTYESLLNQSFKDFDIWIGSGLRNQKLVDSLEWPANIKIVRDRGKSLLNEIEDDYLVITRLDSDDMFRYDALDCIRRRVSEYKSEDGVVGLCFWQYIVWSSIHGTLLRSKYSDQSPSPFISKIFPKKIYQDWDEFYRYIHLKHGRDTHCAMPIHQIDTNKVCVVKHDLNVSLLKLRAKRRRFTEKKRQAVRDSGNLITEDKEEIDKVLKDFGIK